MSLADRSYIEAAMFGWAVLVDSGEVMPAGRRFVAAMDALHIAAENPPAARDS